MLGFDVSEEYIVINDNILTHGRFEFSNVKEIENNKIYIEGKLLTPYYEPDIKSVETRRYSVDNIDVYREDFGSLNDDVCYSFRATLSRVKYQTPEYFIISEPVLENIKPPEEENNNKNE